MVDDDQSFVDEFTLIFADAGFKFKSFLNIEQFEKAWKDEERPDLILIDNRLHGRNGVGLIKALRQSEENIAVILLSTIASEGMALNAFKSGADDFLTKPISVPVLLARISWHIRRVESARLLTKQRNDFQTLVELSNGLNQQDDVASILRTLIDGLSGSLGAESAAFYLRNIESGDLHRALPSDASLSEASRHTTLDLRDLPRVMDGILDKQILYLSASETRFLCKAVGGYWEPNRSRVAAIFPLILNAKLTGILLITNRSQSYSQDRERYIASIISDFAARSVHRASLFDSIRQDHVRIDKTHKELQRAREYFRKLIMASPDGIVAADRGGAIFVMNTAAQDILGYGPHAFIGMNVSELYPEGGAHQIARFMRDPNMGGGAGQLVRHRCVLLDARGEGIPVEISASSILEDGEEVATVGFFVDLRHRIRMQEELHFANKSLAETNRAALIAELAGAAAHELNQPLTALLGYVELLELKGLDENAKLLNSIAKESNRIANVVKKFGAVTNYRTKAYVAGTQIIDLDLASEAELSPDPPAPKMDLIEDLPIALAVADERGFLIQMNQASRRFLELSPDSSPRLDLSDRSTAQSVRKYDDEIYLSDVRILDAGLQYASLTLLPLGRGYFRILFEVPDEKVLEAPVRMLEVLSAAMHHVGLIRTPKKLLELFSNCFHEVFPDFGLVVKIDDETEYASSRWTTPERTFSDLGFQEKRGHFDEPSQMHWQESKRGYRIHLKYGSLAWLQIEKKNGGKFGRLEREAFETFSQQLGFVIAKEPDNALPLIDYMDAVIVVCDNKRRVVVSNETFDRLVDRNAMGLDILEFFEAKTREKVSRAIATFLANVSNSEPFDAVLLSSERRSVNLRIQVHRYPGAVVGFVLIGQQTEQSLLDLDQRMERAEQLVSLGQLATGIAHELKNPLMSILNYADYLHQKYSDSLFDSKDSERLGRIVEGVEQIDTFVKDLLSLANPELSPQSTISIRSVVDEALSLCEVYLERHRASVKIGDHFDSYVSGNAIHLRQVFVNLITNAACAMPQEGGLIHLSFENEKGHLRCVVKDSAVGISPDVLERIFEPFFTTRSGHGGSGLGLAIVKQIIKQHRGQISVQSVLGEGTTFVVTLPTPSVVE